MSLPPGFLDELRGRLSLAQVVARKVMWDARKSNQGKGDMWAPCPFHQEKTASFHVDDRKGFYYCFGCHAKGDAISFVRETENVGFMEAVQILAGEAGMPVPERDPEAQERADRRSLLTEVMEQAVRFFRLQLQTGAAAAARDYLAGRGFDDDKLARWEIGFAPDAWQGLRDHLTGKGVAEDLIVEAGLARESQKGGKPYDTFRNRIIFPIRDARGRAVAFGGRAMDPSDSAKYLNSPETPLFDKSRLLYNHGPAREAAGQGAPLIVAEGYMDVIALSEAGFGAAVAPLGTAVTEEQLRLLWRIAPEPVIALDGDAAGLRAAMRVIDLALPLLEAGQSLRFAILPQGQDPDDLIRASGRGAMAAVVESALPMVRLLWRRETDGKDFDSPERKAALDKALREKLRLIADPSLRSHYGAEIQQLRRALFAPPDRPGWPRGARRWGQPRRAPLATTKSSFLTAAGADERLREMVILATALATPEVIGEFASALDDLECSGPDLEDIRRLVLTLAETEKIDDEARRRALEMLILQRHVAISPGLRAPGDVETARACLTEELAKLAAARGLAREVAEAEADLSAEADEGLTWRLEQAVKARERARRGDDEDRTEYEIGPNGARISRQEREALDRLLGDIGTPATDQG